MITERTKQLVQDIFLQVKTPKVHEEVKEDPEAYLLSLLTVIRDVLKSERKYSAMLHGTIEKASFNDNLEKAKEELGQPA